MSNDSNGGMGCWVYKDSLYFYIVCKYKTKILFKINNHHNKEKQTNLSLKPTLDKAFCPHPLLLHSITILPVKHHNTPCGASQHFLWSILILPVEHHHTSCGASQYFLWSIMVLPVVHPSTSCAASYVSWVMSCNFLNEPCR